MAPDTPGINSSAEHLLQNLGTGAASASSGTAVVTSQAASFKCFGFERRLLVSGNFYDILHRL